MIKKLWRFFKRLLLGLVSILAIYLLLAWLLPKFKVNNGFAETPGGVTIYLCSNGVHTDVVLPVKTPYIDWRSQFTPSAFKAVKSDFEFVEIGWGDKAFYLTTPSWADLKCSTAFKALFFLDSAAMHVTYIRTAPLVEPSVCKSITIKPLQYIALVSYIEGYLTWNESHPVLIPGKGYDADDNFYQAEGHYSFLKTCNVWTGDALKSAGIRQGYWSPFEGGVMSGLDK